jgi:hypothetical protein
MNHAAVLGIIGDLYAQLEVLQQENEGLKVKDPEAQLDPLGGPEEADIAARQEAEGKKNRWV